MREYGFTITEHDPDRPWIVLGTEHRTTALPDDANFYAWAAERWPAPRWTVELDPWQLSRDLRPERREKDQNPVQHPLRADSR